MPEAALPVVVIDDGGLPALVSALMVNEPAATHIWCISSNPRGVHVSQYRTGRLAFASFTRGVAESPLPEMLLASLRFAVEINAHSVVWPFFSSVDVERMSLAACRVRLVEELIALETPANSALPRLETPLLDLDPPRICDLAVDMGAPIDARNVWWCETQGPRVCGRCDECRRWQSALAAPRCWERDSAVAGA